MAELDCRIYKSLRQEDMYLYVPTEDDLAKVPHALLDHFGPPVFVMTLLLSPDRRLARAEIGEVMTQLGERGYYLQLPPRNENLLQRES